MSSASCPGFLDRYGIWNNGFDCSLPRICCGSETDRYCCILSSTSRSSSPSSTAYQPLDDLESYTTYPSDTIFPEKWFFIQMCTIGLCLAILLLIFVIAYLCLTSMRHSKRRRNLSFVQLPLPSTSSFLIQPKRSVSNRLSTISTTLSDVKSQCTDTSVVLNTPLNLYPTANSRNSTVSSSYYTYPNEFEYLCK